MTEDEDPRYNRVEVWYGRMLGAIVLALMLLLVLYLAGAIK